MGENRADLNEGDKEWVKARRDFWREEEGEGGEEQRRRRGKLSGDGQQAF